VKEQDRQPEWHPAKQALSHRERVAMVAQMTEAGTEMDAAELAEALGIAVNKARYHLLVLCRANLIELIEDDDERYVLVLEP